MNKDFWAGRRVFVTGHTGFKGGWLCLWLQQLGADVTGYALKPPTQPSLFNEADVARGMTSIVGDVRNAASVLKVLQETKPEIVVHMAAQSLVHYSYANPVETYETNVMGTVHVLEAVRHTASVRAVVVVTSDKCYENRDWHRGYREIEPMGGYDPYSSSKGCAELVTSAYRNSYFNPARYTDHHVAVASARAGNVIGGGDWAMDRLIPDIMRAMAGNQPVRIRSPHAIRPWQHVLEPLSGYLILAEQLCRKGGAFAEAWNFGPDDSDAKPVRWVTEKLVTYWGGGASWELDNGVYPHEAQYLKLDCSKARAQLGWQPRWDLDGALAATCEWHKAHQAGKDLRQVMIDQIVRFCEAA